MLTLVTDSFEAIEAEDNERRLMSVAWKRGQGDNEDDYDDYVLYALALTHVARPMLPMRVRIPGTLVAYNGR